MPTEEPAQRKYPCTPGSTPVKEGRTGVVKVQYAYRERDRCVVISSDSIDLCELKQAQIRPCIRFMKEGREEITITYLKGQVVEVVLPNIVELQVTKVLPENEGTETLSL